MSRKDRNTDRHQEGLKEYAAANNIKYNAVFEDRASGKDFDRTRYQALKETAKEG